MTTILIVEDEDGIQEILSMILENEGYKVFQAKTLAEAREIFDLHNSELDAILMDRMMDLGNTDSLILEIRKSGFLKPVIAFAGTPDSRKKQIELGCSDQMPKVSSSTKIIEFFKTVIQK